jgi:hypothetical protein
LVTVSFGRAELSLRFERSPTGVSASEVTDGADDEG